MVYEYNIITHNNNIIMEYANPRPQRPTSTRYHYVWLQPTTKIAWIFYSTRGITSYKK